MRNKILFVFMVVLGGLFIVLGPLGLRAASPSGASVTVVPPKFELWGNPGQAMGSQFLRVTNERDAEMTFNVTSEDFGPKGEDGSVELYDNGQSNETYSLAKWIKVEPKTFTAKPGETKVINFTIDVPKNAEPGGRYASIVISMGGGSPVGSGASVSSRVVSLVMLKVAGDVKEEAQVESFEVPAYSEKTPLNFDLRIKNRGLNHIKPKGTILITNMFGGKVAEIPLNGENVLPGAIRKMTTEFKTDKSLAGRYSAVLVASYGERSDKRITATTSFVVFPKSLAVGYGFGLVLLGIAVVKRKKVKKILHQLTK